MNTGINFVKDFIFNIFLLFFNVFDLFVKEDNRKVTGIVTIIVFLISAAMHYVPGMIITATLFFITATVDWIDSDPMDPLD